MYFITRTLHPISQTAESATKHFIAAGKPRAPRSPNNQLFLTRMADKCLAPGLAEEAQAIQRALQVRERSVWAEGLAHYFKPVSKAQQVQRLQQIENLLQTLQGLGLWRRTDGGCM